MQKRKKEFRNEAGRKSADWLEIQGLQSGELTIDRFTAQEGQTWCVLGANNSGIQVLPALLSGKIDADDYDLVRIPDDFRVVSFSGQQELYEEEVRNDDTDYLDRIDPGTPASSFLADSAETADLVRLFNLEHVLESGYRQLSSGESRKLLILEAITHGSCHLLIENPYDGLDIDSCQEFDRIVSGLKERGVALVVLLTSFKDIPDWCSHLLFIDGGTVAGCGPREEIVRIVRRKKTKGWGQVRLQNEQGQSEDREELIRLADGRASYGSRVVFSGLDLLVHKGDHTLITGPNGSGKSTLLSVITGDHPDCYTNELYLFGTRRGSGESIWDLKKHMGIVSPALHRSHYIPGNTLQIVISGFFDSIGLYRKYSRAQEARAREWLEITGLDNFASTPFRRLSFARQRLALICRALIKLPKLLILDEPTQGLDDANRESLLAFLETVAERELSTILYVSHRLDEHRRFFRRHLHLGR